MTDQAEQSFTWSAHPARQRPRAAVGTGAIILCIAAAVWLSFGLVWAIGSLILLIAALNRFFFSSRFTIDDQGITARYPLRKQRLLWANVRRFVTDKHGGYLSTRARPSRMDAYTGMHLLFAPPPNREIAISQIRSHLAIAAPDSAPRATENEFTTETQRSQRKTDPALESTPDHSLFASASSAPLRCNMSNGGPSCRG